MKRPGSDLYVKSIDNPWPKRIACWVAGFFLVAAIGETLLIGLVFVASRRIHLDSSSYQVGWFNVTDIQLWKSGSKYRKGCSIVFNYLVEGACYERKVNVVGDWKENAEGREPWESEIDKLDIVVWDRIPWLSIPIVAGYNPLTTTISVWVMAFVSVAA